MAVEIIEHREGFVRARMLANCRFCDGDVLLTAWRHDGRATIRLTCLDQGHPECLDGDEITAEAEKLIEMIRYVARKEIAVRGLKA